MGAILKSESDIIRFKSKRNIVLLKSGIIEKHFPLQETAMFESKALKDLKAAGLRVPEVISEEETVIKMQYIPGCTLPDLIAEFEDAEDSFDLSAIRSCACQLMSWLLEFYQTVKTFETGRIRGDVNGRNFLFFDNECWGIDFENAVYGTIEEDIGRLLAFVITYDPPGTSVKNALVTSLIKEAERMLGIDITQVYHFRDLEIQAMHQRRKHCQI